MIQRLFRKETTSESFRYILTINITRRIIQTLRGIVFARFLGPAEYGIFTMAFFLIPLAVTLGKLGITSCFTRYIPQYEKKRMLRDFLKKTYFMTLLGASIITVIGLCNVREISRFIFKDAGHGSLIIVGMLAVIPCVFFENLNCSFSGLRVFKLRVLLEFCQFLFFTVLGILWVIFSPVAHSAVMAYFVSYLIVVPVFGFLLHHYLSGQVDQTAHIDEAHFYGKIMHFSMWFILTPIVGMLLMYTDRWMINYFLGLEDVGIYSIAVNMAGFLGIFGFIIGRVLMPRLALAWDEGKKDIVISLMNLSIKINIIILLMGAMIISILKQPLVSLLYGASYLNSLSVISILLFSMIMASLCWTVAGYASLIEKTYIPLVAYVIAFISNVIITYFFIPRFGISGAATATAISITVSFLVISTWFSKQGFRMKVDTIIVCLAPLMIFSNQILSIIFLTVFIILIIKTKYILKEDEKSIMRQQFRKLFSKYRTTETAQE